MLYEVITLRPLGVFDRQRHNLGAGPLAALLQQGDGVGLVRLDPEEDPLSYNFV